MRLPAPRIDYDAIATPGGIGAGLGNLVGSLAQARAMRQRTAADQAGLARLRERDAMADQRAQEEMALRQAQFDETKRSNLAGENIRTQEAGARGLAALAGGARSLGSGLASFMDPEKQARVRYLQARTERLGQPTPISSESYVGALKLKQAAVDALNSAKMTSPKDFQPTSEGEWNPLVENRQLPPKRDYEAELRAINENPEWGAIINRYQDQIKRGGQQAAAPVNAMPTAASTIRKRVVAAYGGAVPPEVEQSILEAEGNDLESLQQLEEMLNGSASPAVAPADPNDLLGQ